MLTDSLNQKVKLPKVHYNYINAIE